MKKFFCVLLMLSMVISFTACGKASIPKESEKMENESNYQLTEKIEETQEKISPLANARKLLEYEKKLTIGYIGGSITYGVSALKKYNGDGIFSNTGGDINLSWVNRVTNWFKASYPKAQIEAINAGVSDTATNLGIFRLEKTLMNTDGHDMPDVVFVEFNVNDWVYDTQTQEDLKLQAESLFLQILKKNPYAEIIVVCSARSETAPSLLAYKAVAAHYDIPMVYTGLALQEEISKRGTRQESQGNYYWTIDNLHPSTEGYGLYFEEIKPCLEKNINKIAVKDKGLYNYYSNKPQQLSLGVINNPKILSVGEMKASGSANKISQPICVKMYGNSLNTETVELTEEIARIEGTVFFNFEFTGNTLGVLFQMTDSDIEFSYAIDGQQLKIFKVDDNNLGFQRYDHTQAYMLAHNLQNKKHTVKIVFRNNKNVLFGGALVG